MRITILIGKGTSGGDRDTIRYSELFRKHNNTVAMVAPETSIKNPLLNAVSYAKKIPPSDAIISIYSLTAPIAWIAEKMGKGKAFYFNWHFEPILFYKPSDYLKKMVATATYRMFPSNRMIANSKFVAEMIYKTRKEEVRVVNPGIDHSVFYPRMKKGNSKKKRILTMARTEKWKGLNDFLSAAKELQKSTTVEVILVSRQREIAHIAQQAGMKFVFAPSDEELAQLYSTCDVFVHSSLYEGFGLPPVEAMACGIPVVMTDSLGVRDYALNGINCLLVSPGNPIKLCQAIERCLTDTELAQSLSKNGLITASAFDIDRAALAHLKIIKEIMSHQ